MVSDLVDEDGKPPGENFRELRTPDSWVKKREGEARLAKEYAISSDGAGGRSIGEHAKAVLRGMFEGTRFRDREVEGGARDRANPLYDRKKLKED